MSATKENKIRRAIDLVFDELYRMHKEEFEKLLAEEVPDCHPETCDAGCQGAGWCHVAEDFRKSIPDILQEASDGRFNYPPGHRGI